MGAVVAILSDSDSAGNETARVAAGDPLYETTQAAGEYSTSAMGGCMALGSTGLEIFTFRDEIRYTRSRVNNLSVMVE
ncbi:MAG: hypothetical protein ABSC88_14145 [Terracidiphilus sp.]|jgi:hypothetical protein